MTKRERALIEKAVRLLYTDDGWDEAMRILLPMAGLRSPAIEAEVESRQMDIYEIERWAESEQAARKAVEG